MLDQSTGLEFNSKGYLVNFDAWSKDFAIQKAKHHGVDLSDCHLSLIHISEPTRRATISRMPSSA